jgi:hypothetical protein
MLHFSGTGEECVPVTSPAFESGSANDSPFVVYLLPCFSFPFFQVLLSVVIL